LIWEDEEVASPMIYIPSAKNPNRKLLLSTRRRSLADSVEVATSDNEADEVVPLIRDTTHRDEKRVVVTWSLATGTCMPTTSRARRTVAQDDQSLAYGS
jgi:hypothetical protein